jgi:hypothetical protein
MFHIGKHGTLWHYYSRANPAAKQSLYVIVNNKEQSRYHQNALRAIGYIGDASDVSRLEKSVHRDFKGVLTSDERNAMVAIFDALAVMSRREVAEATQVLDEMLSRSYWKDISFRWRGEAVRSPLTTVDQLVSWVLWAHARTGRLDDLEEKVIRALNEVDDKQRRDLMAERSSLKRLLSIESRMRAAEKEPISEQIRQQLPTAFNGDLENPALPGTDTPESAPPKPEPEPRENRERPTDAKGFANAVAPAFDAWMEVHKQEQELRRQLGEAIRQSQQYKEVNAQRNVARRAFVDAVAASWPFGLDAETSQTLSEANKALEEGREVHQAYREGKGRREEVLAKWLTLAERFPATIEQDEALYWAGKLYLEHLRPGMKLDIPAARRIYERLVKRPGPPSKWTLEAEENLVAFADDPTRRTNARSQFIKDIAARLDLQWLRTHLLVPTKHSTPERFVRQIDGFLFLLAPVRQTTAHNMVGDAKGTPERFENLKRLKEEHADDPFVEAAFSRDGQAPVTSFWTYVLRVALACVVVGAVIGGGIMLHRRRWRTLTTVASAVESRRRPQR